MTDDAECGQETPQNMTVSGSGESTPDSEDYVSETETRGPEMDDYLIRFGVEQVGVDRTVHEDEIVIRAAGTSEDAAVHGAKVALNDLSTVTDVEVVEVWQDE